MFDSLAPFPRLSPIHDLPVTRGARRRGSTSGAAIAKLFGFFSAGRLVAEGPVRSGLTGATVKLENWLQADVVQVCVVTREAVSVSLGVGYERLYVFFLQDGEEKCAAGCKVFSDSSSGLVAEAADADVVDVGAIAVEELALGLDLYPHKVGALFGDFGRDRPDSNGGGKRFGSLVHLAGWRSPMGPR
jgi:hypothetical protein